MKFIEFISTCCVILFLSGCTWKSDPQSVKPEEKSGQPQIDSPAKVESVKDKTLFSKELNESLHFAASLERESLRLISKNNSFEPATLFSVLSYAFEIASGVKRSSPRGIDCSRFQIQRGTAEVLQIFKICQKPLVLIATIQPSLNQTDFKIIFKTKEWASVVGLSVTLTSPDIECQLTIKEKKLSQLSCENWAYFLSASDASATEVHLKIFKFNRQDELQLKLSGGFYRDLLERKKIEVSVPLQGKIKVFEKEIEVKDDFAEKPKPTNEEPHGQKEKSDKEKNEEYQKFIKTEDQGQNPEPPASPEKVEEGHPEDRGQEINQGPKAGWPPGAEPGEIEQGENAGGVPKQKGTRGR